MAIKNPQTCYIIKFKKKTKQILVFSLDARTQWTCGSEFVAVYRFRKIATSSDEMIWPIAPANARSQVEKPELISPTAKHYVHLIYDYRLFFFVSKSHMGSAHIAKIRAPPISTSRVIVREGRDAYCVSRPGPTGRSEAASGVTVFTCTTSRLCVFRQVESWWRRTTGRRVRNRRRISEATGGHMQASEPVFGWWSLPF